MVFQAKHGYAKTKIYQRWKSMISRCYNPNNINYKHYGGRGIRVDIKWREFYNFFIDMGNVPFGKAQLDRIDNNGDYEPGNVRWTTSAQNNQNRNSNKLTKQQAEEIRKLWNTGQYARKELAKQFNISRDMVEVIINRKQWR
jgi:hypothetical protein